MLLIGFVIALAFGFLEAFLLKKMLNSFTAGSYTAAAGFMTAKLLLYGAALPVLVLLFGSHITECLIGYTVGLPVAVAAMFVYNTIKTKKPYSGDDRHESDNNN